MSKIPVELTKEQFEKHVNPHLSKAKRGYIGKISLFKIFNYILYRVHTGCQWERLPIDKERDSSDKKEISHDAIAYHHRKWSKDGSLKKVWEGGILTVKSDLDLFEAGFDGTHSIAKKGGESVAYQGRKKAKTTNILPVTDSNGYVIGTTGLVAGNHNDSYNLKSNLQTLFKDMKKIGLVLTGTYFNADTASDTKDARKTCFNHGLIPNIKENKRNRKRQKRGPQRFFNSEVYKRRFISERTFGWIDKFKSLVVRYDRKDDYFMGAHHIAFAMLNLRNAF